MSRKEKTAHAVKASEGGAGNQISGQAIGDPDSNSTTFGHKPQGIADLRRCQVVVGKSTRGQNGLRALKSGVTLFCRAGKDTALSGSTRLTVLGRKCFSAVFRKSEAGG